jgi:hypothetical protein
MVHEERMNRVEQAGFEHPLETLVPLVVVFGRMTHATKE